MQVGLACGRPRCSDASQNELSLDVQGRSFDLARTTKTLAPQKRNIETWGLAVVPVGTEIATAAYRPRGIQLAQRQ